MEDLPGGPRMAERLDAAVRAVCPIHGISIGERVDETGAWARDTWRVNPKSEATLNEIEAAYGVLATWNPDAPADAEEEPPQLLPQPDALMSEYGEVGQDDITGDLLLDAFEDNEAETAAVVQTLSALKLKHLSEQLNVERARLDREHQATGVANPRSASIDRLLGLLTRRGEV